MNSSPSNEVIAAKETSTAALPVAPRILDAAALLNGMKQVLIDHQGALYRLSLTKNNRLILQK